MGRDVARNAEQDMEARNHGHKARLRSNNVFRFADAGSFSCIGRGSSRSCLRGLVLPEQKGFEHQLFLELRRVEEKRSVSKSCFEAQRRSKNCGVIRRKRESAVGRHQTFPPPTSTLLPPHRFDLAMMRYTSVVIAAFRAIDRSFGTQYANNRGRRRRRGKSGMWRAFPGT